MEKKELKNELFQLTNDLSFLDWQNQNLSILMNTIRDEVYEFQHENTRAGLALFKNNVSRYREINYLACDYMDILVDRLKDIDNRLEELYVKVAEY